MIVKQAVSRGIRAAIPIVLGFVPVGIAYGIMARQASFTVWQTCMMSLTVFAGASQMMAVGMYAQGAGLAAILFATFMLNLRHLIMSVCVFNRMRPTKWPLKLLAAFGVTDETFAVFATEPSENSGISFFLPLIGASYLSWNVGTLIGAAASNFLPDSLTAALGISLYAMFIGLLVPTLPQNRRLLLLVLFTAICNALLTPLLQTSRAMIVSTLLCALIGSFFVDTDADASEKRKEQNSQ